MKTLFTPLLMMALVGPIRAAETNGTAEDERAIRDLVIRFNDARNAFDEKKEAGFFTEDGEYVDTNGSVTKGRAEREQLFTRGLPRFKGSRAERTVKNIYFVKPDVAVVTVSVELIAPGKPPLPIIDTDVMVKRNDTWRIASQHNLVIRLPASGGQAK
jgi:uncharacterized protein (TIGR02246 family)